MIDIKFRAWDNKNKAMIDWMCIRQSAFNRGTTQLMYDIFTAPSFVGDCGFIPMQFTGLKDKNGKDIYEGDIFIVRDRIYVVSFENGCFVVVHYTKEKVINMYWKRSFKLYKFISEEKCFKVGNIFENDNLLNGFKDYGE